MLLKLGGRLEWPVLGSDTATQGILLCLNVLRLLLDPTGAAHYFMANDRQFS